MKITVEHYDEKVSIETENDDITFDEFIELIRKISYGVGYNEKTIEEWFNNESQITKKCNTILYSTHNNFSIR